MAQSSDGPSKPFVFFFFDSVADSRSLIAGFSVDMEGGPVVSLASETQWRSDTVQMLALCLLCCEMTGHGG